MLSAVAKGRSPARLVVAVVLGGSVCLVGAPEGSKASDATSAAPGPAFVRQARVLDADATGVSAPVGVAFSPARASFYVVETPHPGAAPSAATNVARLTPLAPSAAPDRAGSAPLGAAVEDPINMAFDPRRKRLLRLSGDGGQLLEVQTGPSGDLDPKTLVRHKATRLNLRTPAGMAVDAASGDVFVLDAGQARIVRIKAEPDGTFDAAAISFIDLQANGLRALRGLAFDPSTGHLHVGNGHDVYELSTNGQVVAFRDLSGLDLSTPQGMVFAPSGDQTDAPTEQNLYVADSGSVSSSGQIVELGLTPLAAAAASNFASSLVRTIDTSKFSKPSPDPSGLAYKPGSGTLLMVDGEVDETVNGVTHFTGANAWELTRSGSVVRTANISKVAPTAVPMSNESVGVAFNSNTGHYIVSDDVAKRVFDLNPGTDNLLGTSDDSWTFFSTTGTGNGDPEGVAYDPVRDRLFVADGVNREVYQYTTAGTLVGQFDTAVYGVDDPESVEFNPITGTLFVLSNRASGRIIIETSTSGALIQTIDVSASGAFKPAGLAYAPASNGSGAFHFYVSDRGIDNNDDPNIVDGKVYELTAPPAGNALPVARNDVYTTAPDTPLLVPAPGVLDNDVDANGDPMTAAKTSDPANGTATLNADGSFDYTPDLGFTGVDTFTYTARDSAGPGNQATVTINVSSDGGSSTTTVTPADDAYVRSGAPTQNNGSATTLRVYARNQESYLKFVVPALSGTVTDATLRLFVDQASSVGGTLFPVADDSWSESTLIWDNKPAAGSPALGSLGAVAAGQWVQLDITDAIGGAGTYSFVLKTGASTAAWYSSSEGANPPQLVVTAGGPAPPNTPPTAAGNAYTTPRDTALVVPAPGVLGNDTDADGDSLTAVKISDPASGALSLNTNGSFTYTPSAVFTGTDSFTYRASDGEDESATATVTINVTSGGGTATVNPTKDSYVRSAYPTENNGSAPSLRSYATSARETRSYLSFTVSGLPGTVSSATLRLFVKNESPAGGALYAVPDSSWTESGLIWDNRPVLGSLIRNIGAAPISTWVELDVASVVTGNGTYSFAIAGVSTDVVYYSSKEGNNPPQLVVVTT